VFLPNYNVSLAEAIIPAADLSQQISTAGTEASGTGNMKFCLNGALILGTLDGANIEIRDHVGEDNMFIFGHTVEQLRELQQRSYQPWEWVENNPELRFVLETIERGYYSKYDSDRFRPIWDSLVTYGDRYFHLADFSSYVEANRRAEKLYGDPRAWQQKALANIARIGWFSSDRTVDEYRNDVWRIPVTPLRS
jgi:starch phosphorylase